MASATGASKPPDINGTSTAVSSVALKLQRRITALAGVDFTNSCDPNGSPSDRLAQIKQYCLTVNGHIDKISSERDAIITLFEHWEALIKTEIRSTRVDKVEEATKNMTEKRVQCTSVMNEAAQTVAQLNAHLTKATSLQAQLEATIQQVLDNAMPPTATPHHGRSRSLSRSRTTGLSVHPSMTNTTVSPGPVLTPASVLFSPGGAALQPNASVQSPSQLPPGSVPLSQYGQQPWHVPLHTLATTHTTASTGQWSQMQPQVSGYHVPITGMNVTPAFVMNTGPYLSSVSYHGNQSNVNPQGYYPSNSQVMTSTAALSPWATQSQNIGQVQMAPQQQAMSYSHQLPQPWQSTNPFPPQQQMMGYPQSQSAATHPQYGPQWMVRHPGPQQFQNQPQTGQPGQPSQSGQPPQPGQPQQTVYAALPRLRRTDPETFDGEPLSFLSWFQGWDELVGKNPEIPGFEKMLRLKNCVKIGTAAHELIKAEPPTMQGYVNAMNSLTQRFGDNSKLRVSLSRKLQTLSSSSMSTSSLRKNHDEITSIVNQMEQLGENMMDASALHVVTMIQTKFPRVFFDSVDRYLPLHNNWTVRYLLQSIDEEISRRERNDFSMGSTGQSSNQSNNPKGPKPNPTPTARDVTGTTTNLYQSTQRPAAAPARTQGQQNKQFDNNRSRQRPPNKGQTDGGNTRNLRRDRTPPRPCSFCNAKHWDKDCVKYPDHVSRRKQLIHNELCIHCTQKGHIAQQCELKTRKCKHCPNEGHPVSCCPSQYPPASASRPQYQGLGSRASDSRPAPKGTINAMMITNRPQYEDLGSRASDSRPVSTRTSNRMIITNHPQYEDLGSRASDSRPVSTRTFNGMMLTGRRGQHSSEPDDEGGEPPDLLDNDGRHDHSAEDDVPPITVLATILAGTEQHHPAHKYQAILDSGSQRSYITKPAALALGLPVIATQTLSVRKLNENPTDLVSNRVRLVLQTGDPVPCNCLVTCNCPVPVISTDQSHVSCYITLEANTVAEITTRNEYQQVLSDDDLYYMESLDPNYKDLLADNYQGRPYVHDPQLLLGANVMFKLLEPELCTLCKLSCENGQITTQGIPEKTDLLEIAIIPTATYTTVQRHENPDPMMTILIPIPLAIYNTTVKMELWKNGLRFHSMETECRASDICSLVKCTFCQEYLKNVQCYGLLKYMIIAACTLIPSLLLTCGYQAVAMRVCPSFTSQALIERLICRKNRLLEVSFRFPSNHYDMDETVVDDEQEPEYYSIPSGSRPITKRPAYLPPSPSASTVALTVALIILSCSTQPANSCRLATTLTASSHQCSIAADKSQQCTIEEVTRLTVGTHDTCLLLHDEDGRPNGRLTVTINQVTSTCEKAILYYTRSFATKVESVKRCPASGSCTGMTCELLSHETSIKELTDEANNALGFSRCTESCSCITCGCFFCSSACLFHREFVKPTSNAIYEVFRCPAYRHEVRVTVQLQTEDSLQTETVTLQPTTESSLFSDKLSVALISFSEPTRPLMDSTFVTDQTRTAIVSTAPSGVPVVGQVGQLQCPTKDAAANHTLRSCFTATGACECSPRDNTVSCSCVDVSIEAQFKPQTVLPLQTSTQLIKPSPIHGVITNEIQDVLLELQVSFKGLQISSAFHQDVCTATPVSISGCYSCTSGASLSLRCHSTHRTIASITCDSSNRFAIVCSPSTEMTLIQLAYTTSTIQDTCHVTCGHHNNETTMTIAAVLAFVPMTLTGERTDIASSQHGDVVGGFDWTQFAQLLPTNYLDKIMNILVIIAVIVVCVIVSPYLLGCMSSFSLSGVSRAIMARERN